MSRLTVTLDEELLEEARTLAHVRTKREAIEQALREFVRRRQLEKVLDLMGSDLLEMDDEEFREWRKSAIPRI